MASVRGMIALYLRVALQYCDIHRNVPRYNDSEQDNFTHSPINASLPFEPVFNPDCMNQIFSVFTKEISNNGITPMQSALYSTIYALLTILGLGGNGLIILAVLRRRQMRRSRNFLIANLALSNFLLSSILYPLLWRPDQARFFPFGRFACKLGAAFPASNIYCSTLTIAAMAVERYQAIRKRCANRLAPRASHRESLFFLGLCLLIWLAALFLASPFIFFYDLAQQPPHLADIALADGTRADFSIGFCQLGPRLQQDGYLRLSMSINILQSTFLYLVPSLTLFIFNCRLSHYVSANSMAKAVSRRASAPQTAALIVSSSVQSGGQPSNLLAAPVAHNTTTLRQSSEDSTAVAFGSEMSGCVQLTPTRPSRAVRRRSKLRVLLGTMAGSYALLWLPYTLYVFMLDFGIVHGSSVSTWLDFSVKLVKRPSFSRNSCSFGRFQFRTCLRDWFTCLWDCGAGYCTRLAASFPEGPI